MMEEIWKPVVDIDGYSVSSYGKVQSHTRKILMPHGGYKTVYGREIKQYQTKNGYWYVVLGHTKSTMRRYYIHRLVARAFSEICGKWFDGCEVDHLDTDKNRNIASNLRVVTAKENSNNPLTVYHQRIKKIGKKMPTEFSVKQSIVHRGKKHSTETKQKIKNALIKDYPVIQLDKMGTVIKEYASISEAAESIGTTRKNICNVLNGKQKTAGGYRWKFKEQ